MSLYQYSMISCFLQRKVIMSVDTRDTKWFTYHEQCKTCNMTDKVHEFIEEMIDINLGYAEMSRQLHEAMNIKISADALSNHLKKHRKLEPLLGVVLPPVNAQNTPKGWTPSVELEGDKGVVTSTPQTSDKITDFSDILLELGIDPEAFEVVGPARISKWQQRARQGSEGFKTVWLTAYRLNIQKRGTSVSVEESSPEIDLPLLYAVSKKNSERWDVPLNDPSRKSKRTTVVVFADPQTGKNGSRGGTEELIQRIEIKKQKLTEYCKRQHSATSVFLDAGDIIEGFENVDQQQFTNDLSLMNQVDLSHTFELDFIDLLSRTHDSVIAASVPSNHAVWRKGKGQLGKPSDDWGIHIMKQVEKAYNRFNTNHNVEFMYPDEWKKSLIIPVQGLNLGLVHGDDVNKPEAMAQWWANQCHGGGPVSTADILVYGHFHTFRLLPTGRNPLSGKQKWLVGSPTLDNGSDWYANGMGGGDSDEGLLVFVIDEDNGLDVESLAIL